MGVKAKEPQDAQIIFGDPPLRLTDKTDFLYGYVGKTSDIIVNFAVRWHR